MSKLDAALAQLEFLRTKLDCCLVIDGDSLELFLTQLTVEFIELATQLPCVVACRCSPTQKADVARLIRSHTHKRVCCIGDGGNDVSMIQAADVGLGIVGKEGRQASLAADFSITQFSFITKRTSLASFLSVGRSTLTASVSRIPVLLWHGRNSYKRSAKLAQFVIHRGLIISVMQAVFSAIFFYAPIALFQGWLQVGYATVSSVPRILADDLVLTASLSCRSIQWPRSFRLCSIAMSTRMLHCSIPSSTRTLPRVARSRPRRFSSGASSQSSKVCRCFERLSFHIYADRLFLQVAPS